MARRAFEVGAGSRQPAAANRQPIIGIYERHAYDRVQPEIVEAIEKSLALLEKNGFTIRRIDLPAFDEAADIGLPIARSEALDFHSRWYPERASDYGPDVARSLSMACDITAQAYLEAKRRRKWLARAANEMLEEVDIIAGPTVPIVAFPNAHAYEPVGIDGELPRFAVTRLTYPWNLSRLPAISVPAGLSSAGLPIGLQLASGSGQEAFLLEIAEAFERISPMREAGSPKSL
jgi:aspartyl-tRNA(Asn)/glutamyl-tRNA(Gln) amidotransferase subunit A